MIDTGKDYEAHPAFWAPFVLVGEGGAARLVMSAVGSIGERVPHRLVAW
jgi:hypothetical protein